MPSKTKRPPVQQLLWLVVGDIRDHGALKAALQRCSDTGWIPWQITAAAAGNGYDWTVVAYREKPANG
jgi:hypothetical protein